MEFGGMPDTSSGYEHGSLRPGREREIPKEIAERPWKGCTSKSVLSDARADVNVQDRATVVDERSNDERQ